MTAKPLKPNAWTGTQRAPLKVGLLGATGRMGVALQEAIAQDETLDYVAGHSRHASEEDVPHTKLTPHPHEVFQKSAVVIDFSLPSAALSHLALAVTHQTPYVLGVTGFETSPSKKLQEAGRTIPVLWAPNASLGAVLMRVLARFAAQVFQKHLPGEVTASVLDRHHTQKKDAPSGTAKALIGALKQAGFHDDPQVAAFREGGLCGHHTLNFTHAHERLTLSHDNFDRHSLAVGALKAAKWLAGQPAGLYTMEDMLGLPVLHCSPSTDSPKT